MDINQINYELQNAECQSNEFKLTYLLEQNKKLIEAIKKWDAESPSQFNKYSNLLKDLDL